MSKPEEAEKAKTVVIIINRTPYTFDEQSQTGESLKRRAGIPLGDVLFLEKPGEDRVIGNDDRIRIQDGQVFYSQPPANYGHGLDADTTGFDGVIKSLPQPGGWTFLVLEGFPLPAGYRPPSTSVLVKLPSTFPDAQPDMFWVKPAVTLANGAAPNGTSTERLLGEDWQRFSWHLQPGAWKPGLSTLRDYIRCVRARFAKGD